MARAVALDVRAIAVLLVEMMLNYIRFYGCRQQIRHGLGLPDSVPYIRGGDIDWGKMDTDELLV